MPYKSVIFDDRGKEENTLFKGVQMGFEMVFSPEQV